MSHSFWLLAPKSLQSSLLIVSTDVYPIQAATHCSLLPGMIPFGVKGYTAKESYLPISTVGESGQGIVTFRSQPTPMANRPQFRGTQHQEEFIMKMSVKAMMLSAAITGLLGGTTSTLHASGAGTAGAK